MAGMVIIGAGECGTRAALGLRANGYTGTIDLISDERELPYERPPLSKAVLGDNAAPSRHVTNETALADAQITLHVNERADGIDLESKSVRLNSGQALTYDKLLLATGARPRRLATDGVDLPGIHYLRTMDDCRALRQRLESAGRLLVIGGGFLGLEIAATARQRGCAVTLIETQPRVVMRGVPEAVARVVEARHLAAGVELRCGVAITGIEADADRAQVSLADGMVIHGDLLVACIGALPNAELAAAAGLLVDNGVVVDAQLRTSNPHVFAAGDCCSFPLSSRGGRMTRLESWRSAVEQGDAVVVNMLGGSVAFESVPWFWSDQYELSLQVAGLAEPHHSVVERRLAENAFILFHLDEAGRLVAASGIGPDGAVARDIRLAEMLIAKGAFPDALALGRPEVKLKSLLAAA